MTNQRPDPQNLPAPLDRAGFNKVVFAIVRQIPVGMVMTYGQIASLIPAPKSIDPIAYKRIRARWVGYALADCPLDVPWQRVVNQQGQASPRAGGGHNLQLELLKAEGVPLRDKRTVDLPTARWRFGQFTGQPTKTGLE
jgi:methylated-DNA-protein-cysteine methyltransferase-like protein